MRKNAKTTGRGRWVKPIITRIRLDPAQAVLAACVQAQGPGSWPAIWFRKVSGAYKYCRFVDTASRQGETLNRACAFGSVRGDDSTRISGNEAIGSVQSDVPS